MHLHLDRNGGAAEAGALGLGLPSGIGRGILALLEHGHSQLAGKNAIEWPRTGRRLDGSLDVEAVVGVGDIGCHGHSLKEAFGFLQARPTVTPGLSVMTLIKNFLVGIGGAPTNSTLNGVGLRGGMRSGIPVGVFAARILPLPPSLLISILWMFTAAPWPTFTPPILASNTTSLSCWLTDSGVNTTVAVCQCHSVTWPMFNEDRPEGTDRSMVCGSFGTGGGPYDGGAYRRTVTFSGVGEGSSSATSSSLRR